MTTNQERPVAAEANPDVSGTEGGPDGVPSPPSSVGVTIVPIDRLTPLAENPRAHTPRGISSWPPPCNGSEPPARASSTRTM